MEFRRAINLTNQIRYTFEYRGDGKLKFFDYSELSMSYIMFLKITLLLNQLGLIVNFKFETKYFAKA